MTIEAEFYSHRNGEQESHGKMSIQPGSAEVITHLEPTGVLVLLNVDNTRGEIRIKNPKRVRAFKYRDEDDKLGIRVNRSKPIEIRSGQEVRLLRTTRKTVKETYFWLEPNDDSNEKVPNPEDLTTVLV